ncbi:hypothetical protein AB0O91_21860 [Kitasatospora sp. NPDC089797]|uniref:hypothetical protein n=1 Tax=Kitasatospora sp. NPDC089797 TaxID=3155298 RepID=UPI003440325C
MSNEISIRDITIDPHGRPVHCGEDMEDDYDMWRCWHCNRYIGQGPVRALRAYQGIELSR